MQINCFVSYSRFAWLRLDCLFYIKNTIYLYCCKEKVWNTADLLTGSVYIFVKWKYFPIRTSNESYKNINYFIPCQNRSRRMESGDDTISLPIFVSGHFNWYESNKANNATYYLNVLCVCAYTNATIAKHTEQVWNRIIILRTNNSISNHGWF